MNCKPGDLAVIVRSATTNKGRLVEVVSALGVEPSWNGYRWHLGHSEGQFHWLCRSQGGPLESFKGLYMEMPLPDSILRPIRDPGDDAKDETLDWLPVPQKELA